MSGERVFALQSRIKEHIWQATLSDCISVFTTHPGTPLPAGGGNATPGYWIGNGILPDSVQVKHIHMSIYRLRGRRGWMEGRRARFTHAHFPLNAFDEALLDRNYAFGRLADTYVALIGRYELQRNPDDPADLRQEGRTTYWICDIGTVREYGSFAAFADAIRSRPVTYRRGVLTYRAQRVYALQYRGWFRIDGRQTATDYGRFETPYVTAGRNPTDIVVRYGDHWLELNWERGTRTCSRHKE